MGKGTWFGTSGPKAGDVLEARDGTTFIVTRATDGAYVYGTDTLAQDTFPPLDVEELNGGLARVLRNGGVVWIAREPTEKVAERPVPEPARTDSFPPERFGPAARYLLDVLCGRKGNMWTEEDATEAARVAGLGTVNMEAALKQLFADGFLVHLPRGPRFMLTTTGLNYYRAWRFATGLGEVPYRKVSPE